MKAFAMNEMYSFRRVTFNVKMELYVSGGAHGAVRVNVLVRGEGLVFMKMKCPGCLCRVI